MTCGARARPAARRPVEKRRQRARPLLPRAVHFGREGRAQWRKASIPLPPPGSPRALPPATLITTEVAQAPCPCCHRRREGGVQAFLQVAPGARARGRRARGCRPCRRQTAAPLAGMPLAIKDNMNLVGTRTTCASRMLEDYQSVYTATCVQRMLDAGFRLPLGKAPIWTSLPLVVPPRALRVPSHQQPWDTERVPGGSSGRLRCRRRRARLASGARIPAAPFRQPASLRRGGL